MGTVPPQAQKSRVNSAGLLGRPRGDFLRRQGASRGAADYGHWGLASQPWSRAIRTDISGKRGPWQRNRIGNARLTRHKSTLFQSLAIPLWFPTGKNSVPTDSGIPFECFAIRRPASSPAFGGLIHNLTNTF